jgi:hypothetical protein
MHIFHGLASDLQSVGGVSIPTLPNETNTKRYGQIAALAPLVQDLHRKTLSARGFVITICSKDILPLLGEASFSAGVPVQH